MDGDDSDFQFDREINVIDAGADPTGEEPIDPILEEHLKDGTLLYFPEGRYKLNQFRNFTGEFGEFDTDLYYPLENVGLRGEGSDKVTLVPRKGMGSDEFGTGYFDRLWFELRYGHGHLVEGFTFDYTAENTGGRFQLVPTGSFVMRDVRVEGVNDNPPGNLLFWVLDADEHGLVEDVRMPDGGENPGPNVAGPGGIYVSSLSQGTITFRNCHVEGFQDNGLYASSPSDPAVIRVEGGYYANSNISQVRLGQSDSIVKNATIAVTERIETDYPTNMRGIRQETGGGVTAKNCDVIYTADAPSNGAISVASRTGSMSIENCRIRVDAPATTEAVGTSSPQWPEFGEAIELKNVHITGDAATGSAIRLAGRVGNRLENVCIDQPGADRDGIELVNSEVAIDNSMLDVGDEAIVDDEDSDVTVRNLREQGDCVPAQPHSSER